MEGITVSDAEIRAVIRETPISKIEEAISEYIHDARNRDIARKKIIHNEPYEPISVEFNLTSGQVKNIIKKARRVIYEHI